MHRISAAAAAASLSLVLIAPAAPATATSATGPGTYTNPLTLTLQDGQQAENCADPDVTRGVGADTNWYLYCTSDAIDPTEHDAKGDPVQHLVPTYRSTDLVHWTSTGDAVTRLPSWAKKGSGLWAPEIRHAGGRWFLYLTVPDTTLKGGGSAIAVATSTSPTGPWTYATKPVVAPADNPTSPGDRRWTFDPEVLTVGRTTWIYFGSYAGGIFVRKLSADGLTSDPKSERRIAIANRYEGTNLVRHDGWYYLLASATNCCNGPLTGYSVFAARSRSPLGPFHDADGRSILDAKVGGTPVLSQNGNRWVGTGHDSVITDAAGRNWIVYHAVDRTDPYVAGTTDYTKRAALMDPLDWRNGWPEVRGGAGPSDTAQPAPAAQPGQQDPASSPVVTEPQPGAPIAALSDDFSGTSLSKQWTWIRKPSSGVTVSGGALRWATQKADIHPPTKPLAGILTEPAPSGDFTVTAKVRTTVPSKGDAYNYVQGGLLIYGSDGHYVKLAVSSIYETRQTEFGIQDSGQPKGSPTYGNGVVGPVGTTWTWLRIIRHTVGGATAFTASTSIDGRTWRTGGTWVTDLGAKPRIGLVSMGGGGFTALVDQLEVTGSR